MPCNKKIDDARALSLYDDGQSDRYIGRVFGVAKETVREWRKRRGLRRAPCNDYRLTPSQLRRARNLLRDGASRQQVADHIGISRCTVGKIRAAMDDESLRVTGETTATFRKAVVADEKLLPRISKAIGNGVPPDVRSDATMEMWADLLEGRLRVGQVEFAASRYRSRAFEMAGYNYSTRSIDQVDDDGFSLADTLADPGWEQPFEVGRLRSGTLALTHTSRLRHFPAVKREIWFEKGHLRYTPCHWKGVAVMFAVIGLTLAMFFLVSHVTRELGTDGANFLAFPILAIGWITMMVIVKRHS